MGSQHTVTGTLCKQITLTVRENTEGLLLLSLAETQMAKQHPQDFWL